MPFLCLGVWNRAIFEETESVHFNNSDKWGDRDINYLLFVATAKACYTLARESLARTAMIEADGVRLLVFFTVRDSTTPLVTFTYRKLMQFISLLRAMQTCPAS